MVGVEKMTNIKSAISELHKSFNLLNQTFFEGELPEPAITIQTSGKRKSMGWCSTKEVWSDRKGSIKKYELNISAEYLNIEFMDTMDTLLHEMVHLYNAINGVKDCSRGGTYHNKRFKTECEKRGFYFTESKPDKKYGWSFAKLTEETKETISTLGIDHSAFVLARKDFTKKGSEGGTGEEGESEGEEKKPKSYKWTCPTCKLIVRSTKENVNIKCGDCDETLLQGA